MKKFLLIVIVLTVSCTGCVSATYKDISGVTLIYKRWLVTQKITGLSIIKDKDGLVKFKFDSQESTEGKVLSDVVETIKNLSEKLP